MLKIKNFFLLIFLIISSCASKKDIIYIQDAEEEDFLNISYEEYKIKVDDVLKIEISTTSPDISLNYTYSGLNSGISNSKDNLLFNGFQVDVEGNIDIPNLGKIKVIDKTLIQAKELIFNKLVFDEDLVNPSVDVKFLNNHFTILGEVKVPGRYDYLENNLNVLEAIGLAGDLTINGKRKDIKIIRSVNGVNQLYNLDLTDTDFLTKKYFQIVSGDIIIVNPNSTRVKNAGIIGNSGTLLSLLSFLLSTVIVIGN